MACERLHTQTCEKYKPFGKPQTMRNFGIRNKIEGAGLHVFFFFLSRALKYFKDRGYQEPVPQQPVLPVFSSMLSEDKHLKPGRPQGTGRGMKPTPSYLFALSFSSSSIRFSMQFFLQKKEQMIIVLLLDLSYRSVWVSSFCSYLTYMPESRASQTFGFQQNPLHSQQ